MNTFYVKSAIVRDGFFGGPMWRWLPELGTPQPKEGWELLSPEFPIWRDEIVYVLKTPWEEPLEVLFERWKSITESTADECFDKECGKGWPKGTLDGANATMRAILEVWHDGVWGKGMAFEEWAKRMEVLRSIKFLQDEWDIYRTHKRWYIIIQYNAAPMVSSLTFLLSRLNFEKAYYLTFGQTTILSAATVERLMETHAFAGLSIVNNEKVESSKFEKIKTSLGLGTGLLNVSNKEETQSWPDAVLQAAAKRRNIIINPNLAHHFSNVPPQWTHISPKNHCDIIIGFHNLSPSDYQYTLKHLGPEPAPAWPLLTFDLWEKLGGFPTWEGMYTDNYYGRASWDNVGPTSQNKTRLIHEYWGQEYAEYDDGSWSIIHEDISNDCQEICYKGGIAPEPHPAWENTRGKEKRCLAYKSEVLGFDGEVLESLYGKDGMGSYGEGWSGLTKCTFAPWKVVGERAAKWSMVNYGGGVEGEREWKKCPELDGRQFVEPRLFGNGRSGSGW